MQNQNLTQLWNKSYFPKRLANEEIQLLCRRDVNFLSSSYLSSIFWYLGFLVLYFVFVNFLDEPTQVYLFRYLLSAIGGILCIFFVSDFQKYFLSYFVITDHRLIFHKQTSFFASEVVVVDHDRIKSVEIVDNKFQPTNPNRELLITIKERFGDNQKILLPAVNNSTVAQKVFNKFLTFY
jgi:hypothetical protein